MLNDAGFTDEDIKSMGETYPLKRIGHVNEISAAILFAVSEGASFVTGSNIFVDGGLLA